MIDIAFSKLAIIGVAALVFIGPEKLPKVARMAGTLFGRAQRYINEVKSEVSREMELDELRKMHQDIQSAAGDVERTISRNLSETEGELRSVWDEPSGQTEALSSPPFDSSIVKSKDFRKKKLAHTSAVPSWYKRQSGQRSRVISGAARMAKYRPASARKSPSFFQ
ncbi:MAG TPA: Sec-independent protein translocase protein TatB [Oxalicibacterium sp.]|uniref:Sec-independent protein translocase protein TatB n=1 Tax=Oxalicibacterium sp. TaxID=2766525 RepID=UPI002CE18EA9|nr:Sec-independent protein translocase protein TatB [Oxalicibacterium sp.]HWU98896.1 Sec-independent protein translocase protein TatB [Oxalicibacterium sp.]